MPECGLYRDKPPEYAAAAQASANTPALTQTRAQCMWRARSVHVNWMHGTPHAGQLRGNVQFATAANPHLK